MAAIVRALSNFATAIVNVFYGVLNSIYGVVHAFVSLFQAILSAILSVAQAIVSLFKELVQDTLGFVFANFFLVCMVGAGYYVYTVYNKNTQGRRGRRTQ